MALFMSFFPFSLPFKSLTQLFGKSALIALFAIEIYRQAFSSFNLTEHFLLIRAPVRNNIFHCFKDILGRTTIRAAYMERCCAKKLKLNRLSERMMILLDSLTIRLET